MMPLPTAKPLNIPQSLAQALDFHHQGRLAEADRLYAGILAARPDNFDALHMSGLIRLATGNLPEALRLVAGALKARPSSPQVLLNYGLVLNALNRHEEALASFDRALKYKGKYAEAFNNRGAALAALGRDEQAVESYERAIKLKPDYAEAFSNLGNALKILVRYDEALDCFDRALVLKPNYAKAHNNRGTVLAALKRQSDALACYERALALDPRSFEALNNRGSVFRALGRHAEALASLDTAITINPNFAQAWYNRGAVLSDLNRPADAVASYEAAARISPKFAEAKFAACIGELPVLYHDETEIAARRAAYEAHLRALDAQVTPDNAAEFLKGIGGNQPFYLAYQGHNDRDLQKLYGALVCRVIGACYPLAAPVAPPAPGEPIRVGIVSGYFYDHSNWKIPIKGWLSELDRGRFRLFGYHTGIKRDLETDVAAGLCERFVHGPMSIARWRETIEADQPHILIYPEVGMDETSVQLAAQRIAKVQCNSWGHPDTSGFPTLDYYLSSDLMEPRQAQSHYSEKLVRLANLSIHYEPPLTIPVPLTRAELGLRDGATVYWCGQSLYKYLPQYDWVFPRIAREVSDCQFAFIAHQGASLVSDQFRARLDRAFSAAGLDAAHHCVVMPRLDRNRFAAAIGQCDVVLDSIGWSGCNSTLESLVHDLPVVTMPGEFMRGRHSAAILQMMDVTETTAATIEDYVALAARLAREPDWRKSLKARIAANKARLYRDRAPVTNLENFIEQAVRGV